MKNNRRTFAILATLLVSISSLALVNKPEERTLQGLFYRNSTTTAWAFLAAYDSLEECQKVADGMIEGGPYEFRIVAFDNENVFKIEQKKK